MVRPISVIWGNAFAQLSCFVMGFEDMHIGDESLDWLNTMDYLIVAFNTFYITLKHTSFGIIVAFNAFCKIGQSKQIDLIKPCEVCTYIAS
jgi:hypothetical protein